VVPTTLDDYLAIAGELLDADVSALAALHNLGAAAAALAAPFAGFGDVELYPDPVEKLSVLGHRVVRCHALPDGNKRMGFLVMLEFAERNQVRWSPPDDAGPVIATVAAGELDEAGFLAWVRTGIG
jgi:death-on-curing protein